MKFGDEFNDRSVSKWRNYNIDYNDIKRKIKEATTAIKDSSSSLSDKSNDTNDTGDTAFSRFSATSAQDKKTRKHLKQLFKAFKEQIEFTSLFVNSKYGEISRRILATKSLLNNFINSTLDSDSNPSAIQQRLQRRRLMLIQKELEIVSGELQDLSRFILLQKIAVKKLFKKFIKHSDYPHKQELVDKITTECLNGNPNSFVNLYLNDAALELTLMFDVINNYRANQTQADSSVRNDRKQSFATVDSFGLSSLTDGRSKDFIYSRATTFDLISHKKGSVCQRFWVHKDNLDEMKFKLLSGFKLISDDSGIMDEEHEQEGLVRQYENQRLSEQNSSVHLKHTRSELDLTEHAEDPETTFHPDTKVVSIWLNNLDDPLVTSQNGVGFLSTSDNFLSGGVVAQIHNTQYPNSKRAERPLLISPIGGLHQFAMTSLSDSLIHSLFSPSKLPVEVFKNKVLKEWCESGLFGNPKMAQLSLDWCIDKKMAPLAKVAVNRLRFISVTEIETSPKVECYITLDSDIQVSKITSQKDVNFHMPEESISFPHSILEIKYDSPLKVLPSAVQSLINSHLVYRVDNLNFSLNNYLLSKFYQDSLTDEAMLEYVAPWFDDLQNKDIRKLPSIAKKVSEEPPKQSSPQGILLNKYEAQLQQQQELQQQLLEGKRYWNEFDDGSDPDDDQGYYVDDDEYEYSDSRTPFGNFLGLGFLTSSRVEAILNLSNRISSKLMHIINSFKHEESSPLLPAHQDRPHFYKSVINGTSPLENDTESDTDNSDHKLFIHRYSKQAENERSYRRRQPSLVYGEARSNDLLAQVNHDRILSFLYLTAMLVSFLTTGVGLGVIFSTLESRDDLGQTSGMILLLCFGMGCLVLSLILSGVSVCLLMTRYSNAPMWHQASVYSSLIVVTILFIISLVSCL
ncbi:hypothetical protein KL909_001997 [Ogataea angusta]|nr:hypothetical protein KL909_001997 [Ogataea angusta]